MKNQTFTKEFASFFKKGYSKKMGGTQTIVLPNGQQFDFDDREYYQGNGAKYNSSSMHDNLGEILVTEKQVKERLNQLKDWARLAKERDKKQKEANKRILTAKKEGIYSIKKEDWGTFVELSDQESYGKVFDAERLAKTLGISVTDADLLKSWGKTYVFAKSSDGNVYELYHSSLSCNPLCISVEIATGERIAQFKGEEWFSAPFASEVGNTFQSNHFVC